MVKTEGMSNTKVIVTGGGSEDLVAKRNAPELLDANDGRDWNARLGDGVDMPTNTSSSRRATRRSPILFSNTVDVQARERTPERTTGANVEIGEQVGSDSTPQSY